MKYLSVMAKAAKNEESILSQLICLNHEKNYLTDSG